MLKLTKSLAAWNTPEFAAVFKQEVAALESSQLPLQDALALSSDVADTPIEPVILHSEESETKIQVKTGIFYSGIIAGSCCADDPTPVCEQMEYCELQFIISKGTAETRVLLLPT